MEDNVFEDQEELTDTEMPTRARTAEEVHQTFNDEFRDWQNQVKEVIEDNGISETVLEDFKADYKAMKDMSKILLKAAGDNYEAHYPNVSAAMKTIRKDIAKLEKLISTEDERDNGQEANQDLPQETDEDLDNIITSLSVAFDVAKQNLTTVKAELRANFNEVRETHVEVTEKRTLAVRNLLDQAETIREKNTSTQLEVSQTASLLSPTR